MSGPAPRLGRWLALALLLSVGVNVGVLAMVLIDRLAPVSTVEEPEPASSLGADELDGERGFADGPPRRGLDGPGPPRPGPDPRLGEGRLILQRFEVLADEMGLEGERRERFLALQYQLLERSVDARRRGRELQRSLQAELLAAEPDRERVEALVDEVAAVRRELDRTLAFTVLESRALIGPEAERAYLRFLGQLRLLLDGRGPAGRGLGRDGGGPGRGDGGGPLRRRLEQRRPSP